MKRWRVFRAPKDETGGLSGYWLAQRYGTTTAVVCDNPGTLYFCIEAIDAGRMEINQLGTRERELLVPKVRP